MTGHDHRAAFGDLLSLLPVGDLARDDLARRMRAPDRFYHNDEHIGSMWSCNRAWARDAGLDNTAAQCKLACAIAFHDSVLVPSRSDNERRSAELWLEVSRDGLLSAEDKLAVTTMIEATANHGDRGMLDLSTREFGRETQWLLDLDLMSLGATRDVFERNTQSLRREAQHLDDSRWRDSLRYFFERLLASDPLYRCRPTADRFEVVARENMKRTLASLDACLLPLRKLGTG